MDEQGQLLFAILDFIVNAIGYKDSGARANSVRGRTATLLCRVASERLGQPIFCLGNDFQHSTRIMAAYHGGVGFETEEHVGSD